MDMKRDAIPDTNGILESQNYPAKNYNKESKLSAVVNSRELIVPIPV
jgi:hypothetical protein